MKKIKSLIIILVMLVIIISVILIIIKNKKQNEIINDEYITHSVISYEKDAGNYYTVLNIVNKYVLAVSRENNEELLAMLNKDMVNKYNITKENVIEKTHIEPLENVSAYYDIKIKDMYTKENKEFNIYFVYGYLVNGTSLEKTDLNIMIILDNINGTFNIYLEEYIKENGYNKLKIGDSLDINIDRIPNINNYNTYKAKIVTEDEMAYNYFEDYMGYLLIDTEYMYELLDDEYASARFIDKEDFNSYIKENKIKMFTDELDTYSFNWLENGKKQYACKTKKGNYYIFEEENGIMEYSVKLDNYTIDTDNFIEAYDSTNVQGKVSLNIDKFIKAINDKNYYYAYSLISEGFKDNYFKTIEEFESYIKENFYINNQADYQNGEFSKEDELYKYKIQIKNLDNENEQKTKTFIMKLNEDRKFEMSFNIE